MSRPDLCWGAAPDAGFLFQDGRSRCPVPCPRIRPRTRIPYPPKYFAPRR